ncbi:MAG: DUF1080 domain-containing protein [Tannerellaceae bacterium]|nr:DUF1080 domain-containing protein [Tannerellaceae bacterium]
MKKLITSVIIGAAVLTACGGGSSQSTNPAEDASVKATNVLINELSAQEKADGWVLLFDGKTSNGWRGAHKDAFPEHGWKIENGELIVLASDGSESTNGGDIVSDGKYSAFELSVDFKITKGANSGIKYFVTEGEKQKDSAYGLEFQILDDEVHPDAKLYTTFPDSRKLAGLYDLKKSENVKFNGVGEWNTAVIKVFPNNHVEHWLNGVKVLEYERGSDEFRELVKGSKYAHPSYNEAGPFGEAPAGRILLQDHGDEVAFRNIKIRELN